MSSLKGFLLEGQAVEGCGFSLSKWNSSLIFIATWLTAQNSTPRSGGRQLLDKGESHCFCNYKSNICLLFLEVWMCHFTQPPAASPIGYRFRESTADQNTLWICVCVHVCVRVYVCECVCVYAQSCPTLCDPMDSSSSGTSVHGILQARTLEWAAISFSRGSSWPRDWTCISCVSCIGRWILYHLCTTLWGCLPLKGWFLLHSIKGHNLGQGRSEPSFYL